MSPGFRTYSTKNEKKTHLQIRYKRDFSMDTLIF